MTWSDSKFFWSIKKTVLYLYAVRFKYTKHKNAYDLPEQFRCLTVRELYKRFLDLTMTIEISKRLPDNSAGDCMRQYMMEHTKAMARQLDQMYVEWTSKNVTTVLRFGPGSTSVTRFRN